MTCTTATVKIRLQAPRCGPACTFSERVFSAFFSRCKWLIQLATFAFSVRNGRRYLFFTCTTRLSRTKRGVHWWHGRRTCFSDAETCQVLFAQACACLLQRCRDVPGTFCQSLRMLASAMQRRARYFLPKLAHACFSNAKTCQVLFCQSLRVKSSKQLKFVRRRLHRVSSLHCASLGDIGPTRGAPDRVRGPRGCGAAFQTNPDHADCVCVYGALDNDVHAKAPQNSCQSGGNCVGMSWTPTAIKS